MNIYVDQCHICLDQKYLSKKPTELCQNKECSGFICKPCWKQILQNDITNCPVYVAKNYLLILLSIHGFKEKSQGRIYSENIQNISSSIYSFIPSECPPYPFSYFIHCPLMNYSLLSITSNSITIYYQ